MKIELNERQKRELRDAIGSALSGLCQEEYSPDDWCEASNQRYRSVCIERAVMLAREYATNAVVKLVTDQMIELYEEGRVVCMPEHSVVETVNSISDDAEFMAIRKMSSHDAPKPWLWRE